MDLNMKTDKPCEKCVHYDASDQMCCREHKIGSLNIKRAPPMRDMFVWAGEKQCGAFGDWFEPMKNGYKAD